VGQCSGGEPANRTVQKLLVLVQLDDMFLGRSIMQEISPRFLTFAFVPARAAG
jgi:hypothetical protein